MPRVRTKQVSLARFAHGTARLSPEYCGFVAAACASKFKQHGHSKPAQLRVEGAYNETINVAWDEPDARTEGSLGEKATEFAGECIGIVLSEKLTAFNVVERSWIGTGFDFWLGKKKDPLFQRKARLETSGLDDGGNADIDTRVSRKKRQVGAGSHSSCGECLIIVSQFRRPIAKVVRDA
ncbi:MAG: hypothetical protein QOF78_473 [Phycisphaerales bacterium]|jgi:hypothetical protein|nr:hypothetical protein [Phycisphaerales bacterium]